MQTYPEDIENHCSPLVSIIIPTYNNASVVCQAIDCSLHQTYENLEIIVVDDGSTDNTEQLLKEKYKDKIIYVRQENKGPGGARNTGIKNAKGKFLQFLDADDLLEYDKISIQLNQLKNTPGIVLSYCDYVCCDIDDMEVTYKRISPELQKERPFDDIMLKWETDLSIPIHSFIFDMSIFKEFGISFDESLSANEDWECWMNIFALNPKVVFVNRPLSYSRVRKDSRCRNRLEMRKSYLDAINKQIKKHNIDNDIVNKLNIRKKEIKFIYHDVSPIIITLKKLHPLIINTYYKLVPWRIQRMLD